MRLPNYETVDMNDTRILLRDVGPWDRYPTITNAAEELVAHFASVLAGRRLEYIDSEDNLTELRVKDGQFVGFGDVL